MWCKFYKFSWCWFVISIYFYRLHCHWTISVVNWTMFLQFSIQIFHFVFRSFFFLCFQMCETLNVICMKALLSSSFLCLAHGSFVTILFISFAFHWWHIHTTYIINFIIIYICRHTINGVFLWKKMCLTFRFISYSLRIESHVIPYPPVNSMFRWILIFRSCFLLFDLIFVKNIEWMYKVLKMIFSIPLLWYIISFSYSDWMNVLNLLTWYVMSGKDFWANP